MKHNKNFTMRISPDDSAIIEELARRLDRSRSDALRSAANIVLSVLRREDMLHTSNLIESAASTIQAKNAQELQG